MAKSGSKQTSELEFQGQVGAGRRPRWRGAQSTRRVGQHSAETAPVDKKERPASKGRVHKGKTRS